jgi:hypothetical protein
MSKRIVFFSGAAMDPQLILAGRPSARFIARARVTASAADISSSFSRALVGRGEAATVWGIAFETDDAEAAETHPAFTDEGTPLDVAWGEHPLVGGNPEAALDAALYWELPPAYTGLLREAAGIAPPEAEGGWETMNLQPENDASPGS